MLFQQHDPVRIFNYLIANLPSQGEIKDGTFYIIDSGVLNNGFKVSYDSDDNANGYSFVPHFQYINNPGVLIEYFNGIEAKIMWYKSTLH